MNNKLAIVISRNDSENVKYNIFSFINNLCDSYIKLNDFKKDIIIRFGEAFTKTYFEILGRSKHFLYYNNETIKQLIKCFEKMKKEYGDLLNDNAEKYQ